MTWTDSRWFKAVVVLLLGCVVLVGKQLAETHVVDLYALAGHVASEVDKMLVGGLFGWLLAGQPSFMRPSEPEEPPA